MALLASAWILATGQVAVRAEEPPDRLSGPPFVTAKAWAIADGKTGKLLAGHDSGTPRKAASTTKIMAAYVVLKLAEADPKVLEEIVTVSRFAEDTRGSTAGLKEGERVVVSELLYGLLLPSGNDAGNALAEHFNDRFPPLSAGEAGGLELPDTPRARFVAEMNRTASRLGMTDTTYRIPYGDGGTPEDATTSPRDLLRLAKAAMQSDRFRTYVATQKHAGTILQPDGATRTADWTNTNKLLKVQGYDGVKTGSTGQAGSCLVSSNRRGNDYLLCVVLGSTSDDARYVDTRNLLRWAWLRRGHQAD